MKNGIFNAVAAGLMSCVLLPSNVSAQTTDQDTCIDTLREVYTAWANHIDPERLIEEPEVVISQMVEMHEAMSFLITLPELDDLLTSRELRDLNPNGQNFLRGILRGARPDMFLGVGCEGSTKQLPFGEGWRRDVEI